MHVPNRIMVWYSNVALWLWRYEVGCVLTHGFWGWDTEWDGPNQHAYCTQPNFLTHISSPVEWPILNWIVEWLNLASKQTGNGLFQPFFDQITVKRWPFFVPNSAKLVEDAKVQCHWLYFSMVQQVSYVYENFPTITILPLAGLIKP